MGFLGVGFSGAYTQKTQQVFLGTYQGVWTLPKSSIQTHVMMKMAHNIWLGQKTNMADYWMDWGMYKVNDMNWTELANHLQWAS